MEKTKIYQWRNNWTGYGVDPNIAIEEITKAEEKFGEITPKTVLEIAKNKKSAIHQLFDWNNNSAANKFRLEQARKIINNLEIKIISNNEPINVPIFEVVSETNQFKSIETMTFDEVEYVKLSTIKQIDQLKNKLSVFDRFHKAVELLDMVKEELINNQENG